MVEESAHKTAVWQASFSADERDQMMADDAETWKTIALELTGVVVFGLLGAAIVVVVVLAG